VICYWVYQLLGNWLLVYQLLDNWVLGKFPVTNLPVYKSTNIQSQLAARIFDESSEMLLFFKSIFPIGITISAQTVRLSS